MLTLKAKNKKFWKSFQVPPNPSPTITMINKQNYSKVKKKKKKQE